MTLSRRTLLAVSATKLVGLESNIPTPSILVLAGKRFDELRFQLDSSEAIDDSFWSEFRATTDYLVKARAVSAEDYLAKAKAAAWARLGDLDPPRHATLDIRIAIAVLRDIIVQNDPALYQSGALSRMYTELEEES